jgi:hypothetical protein
MRTLSPGSRLPIADLSTALLFDGMMHDAFMDMIS